MHGQSKYGPNDTHLDYANPEAPKGGDIKMAATGSFDTLNPYALKGQAAQGLNLVYDRLMARVWDEPFTLYPLIAERVDVPEDRSSLTVHINPKARFHDRSPVTADDVIFSFETLRDLGRPNMRRIYKLVENVKKLDAHGVRFSFGEGYDRETVMIVAMMPVLSKTYWEGRDFEATLLEPPLLNGPYRIKEVHPGRKIVYERVKDYWAKDLLPNVGHYNFDTLTYDYFRDDTAALESFMKGDLDLRYEFNASKWETAYGTDDPNLIKYEAPHQRPQRVKAMIFNLRRAPFDDLNVRQALALALDEEWIGKNIYYGKQRRIQSYFPNSVLSRPLPPDEAVSYRMKLRQAADLLKQAGWVIEDGKLVKDGKPFHFEIILNAQEDEKIALNFKKALERLGISMDIRVLDSATFQKRSGDYDYDMVLHYWQNSLSPGTEQMLYWGCDAAGRPAGFNYSGICDPQIDTVAASIADARDYNELTRRARHLDMLLWDKTLSIPLFYSPVDYIAYHPPLSHPSVTPIYGSVLESWWTEGKKNVKHD